MNSTACFAQIRSRMAKIPLWLQALILVILSRALIVLLFLLWRHQYGESSGLFDALFRYDSGWYVGLASQGYVGESIIHLGSGEARWAFFPLAPLLEGCFSRLTGLDVSVAGVLLNTVFLYLLTWASAAYLQRDNQSGSLLLMLLINFGPYTIYYSTLYTETLFVLLVCLFLFCMRRGWWLRMGICGALASVTRNMGVFLVFAVLAFCIQQYLRQAKELGNRPGLPGFLVWVFQKPRLVLGTFLVPFGLFSYMAYLDWLVGDGLAFAHVQIAWQRTPGNPLLSLISGLNTLGANEFYFALWTLVALYLCCRQALRRNVDSVVGFLFILIPLSTSILCMPRYAACCFPVIEEAAYVLVSKGRLEKVFWYGFLLLLGVVTTWQWFCNNPVMA